MGKGQGGQNGRLGGRGWEDRGYGRNESWRGGEERGRDGRGGEEREREGRGGVERAGRQGGAD